MKDNVLLKELREGRRNHTMYKWRQKIFRLPGNSEEYDVTNVEKNENSPLRGKTMIFLGSSVTYGAMSMGHSFVEDLVYKDGITAVKEAVSGTTLVDKPVRGLASYIARMKQIDPAVRADAFVCQLSTNDATRRYPLGEIKDFNDPEELDTLTVTGAIDYVIAYAKKTWKCPVIFYTGTYYDSPAYKAMVERLLELKEIRDIDVIDLYHNEEMNAIDQKTYNLYMHDPIHPTKAGYLEWWTPQIEKELIRILEEKA